jgi:hydrogenase maturation factor HypF (carbamoyltransferase family)
VLHGIVLARGIFQNELLLRDFNDLAERERLQVWTNRAVPSNDGGISLVQAALGALTSRSTSGSFEDTGSEWLTQLT